MAYETFAGKDATGATVSWIGDQLAGGFVLVCKLDAGGDGVSAPVTAATPLPVTMPLITSGAPLPISMPGVTTAAPLPVREPTRGNALAKNAAGITPTTASVQVAAANGSRTVIEVSNGTASGVWLAFGVAAVANTGTYLPSKATGYWYTTAQVNCILETGGTGSAAVGFTEW